MGWGEGIIEILRMINFHAWVNALIRQVDMEGRVFEVELVSSEEIDCTAVNYDG